ncbi:MAG: hypothetical protein ABJH07_00060 [Sedimentitalea sp.]|uniref:hypothetical protein n=1 Tax=Sedimentitalea sp. TaxID=2048915 RepID=UPI00326623BC
MKAGEISLSNAAFFTITENETNALAVLEQVRGEHHSDDQIKQMLKPESGRRFEIKPRRRWRAAIIPRLAEAGRGI